MILPQSSAFATLRNRLNCVSHINLIADESQEPLATLQDNGVLLDYFRKKHFASSAREPISKLH